MFFLGQSEPPRITNFLQRNLLAPEDVKFKTDNAMRLQCAALGNNLQWTWKNNDTEISAAQIPHGNQFKVSSDGTLTGSNLGSSQSGNYQCFVKDTVTNVETLSRKIQVAVTGKKWNIKQLASLDNLINANIRTLHYIMLEQ